MNIINYQPTDATPVHSNTINWEQVQKNQLNIFTNQGEEFQV
jgi:hypothetical protein